MKLTEGNHACNGAKVFGIDTPVLVSPVKQFTPGSGVVSEIFELLARCGVNIDMISYSRGVLSLMVKVYRLDDALEAFEDIGVVPEIGV